MQKETFPYGGDTYYSTDQLGLAEVVRRIMPNGVVKRNHLVKNVDFTGQDGLGCPKKYPVKVTFQDTATIPPSCQFYCAKKVITTTSYGVIQRDTSLFTPSIDTGAGQSPWREMGNLVKVYFRFPTKFWANKEYITFAMKENFRKKDGFIKCDYFYNLDKLFSNAGSSISEPKGLFCFVSGSDIDFFDFANKATLSEQVYHLLDPLREAFKDDGYVEPNCWMVRNWDDEYHAGAYGVWEIERSVFVYDNFYKPRTLQTKPNKEVLMLSGEGSW